LNLWDQRCPLPIPLTIKRFREKPSPKEAENLFRSGCLWNTFFMATKAMNLWTLGWRVLPKVMGHFDDHLRTLSDICEYNLGSSHEAMALQRLYNRINVIDFSKNVLEKAHKWCSVLPVDQLGWSDWGAPKRMKESLRQGNASVIPMECVRTLRRESE
jgi:mannose-1-phosphate guanylyltransferase